MSLLVQNKKMKNSSIDGLKVYNFGIPALYSSKQKMFTCPNASACAKANGCYALQGAYKFSNVAKAYEDRLTVSLTPEFNQAISLEIDKALKSKKTKKLVIRIHDSGDFYSAEYLVKWLNIMARYPQVQFYAYTKMVELFKGRFLPDNFKVIYSLGGKQDSLIDQKTDRHSKVFQDIRDLISAGYVDTSHDDMLALGDNPKIGLVYHGGKNFTNTAWGDVA